MTAMPISTLEILEESQMPAAYARSIAKALEADSAARREELVTKHDLQHAVTEMRQDLLGARQELKGDIAHLRQDFELKLATGLGGLEVKIAQLESRLFLKMIGLSLTGIGVLIAVLRLFKSSF